MSSAPTEPPASGGNVVPLRAADAQTEVHLDEDKPPGPSYVDLTSGERAAAPADPRALAHLGERQDGMSAWPRPGTATGPRTTALRSPAYFAKALGFAVWGVIVTAKRLIAWWHIPGTTRLEWEAAADGLLNEHLRLHKQGRETRKARGTILALCLAGLAAAAAAMARVRAVVGVGARRGGAVRGVRAGRAPAGQDDHDAGRAARRRCSRPTATSSPGRSGRSASREINQAINERRVRRRLPVAGPRGRARLAVRGRPALRRHRDAGHRAARAARLRAAPPARRGVARGGQPRARRAAGVWVGRADISKAKPPPWPLLRTGQAGTCSTRCRSAPTSAAAASTGR